MLGGVEIADHDIDQLALFFGDQIVLVTESANDIGIVRQSGHQLTNAFLNPLGDDDLALASEEFHGAHLAHVHAYRVRGAAGFLLHRRQRRRGFGCRDIIRRAIAFGHQ